jgi:hypothetical protein
MAITGYKKVLDSARKLPMRAQAELIETLLGELNELTADPYLQDVRPSNSLEVLKGMSIKELKALADATLAPGRQRRLNLLLRKNKSGNLNEKNEEELDAILDEGDRLALLKAKAHYSLQK